MTPLPTADTSTIAATVAPPLPPTAGISPAAPHRRSSPLLYLIMVAGCVTMADLLLTRGARSSHGNGDVSSLNLLANFGSLYTIFGILFHIAGLGAWMLTLRRIPLTLAYCFTAVQQATIALGAWLWLGEQISPLRWTGIALVFAGVLILVPAIVAADSLKPSREVAQ